MIVKGIIFEDFVNYKEPCMTIMMPKCNFKCDHECGKQVCQNSPLASAPVQTYSIDSIIRAYQANPIVRAICFQGLEPFDTFDDLRNFIFEFRNRYFIKDDIIIYTGYYSNEIENELNQLKQFPNIIVKFGRYVPDSKKHHDRILGVDLASTNQYAERIS